MRCTILSLLAFATSVAQPSFASIEEAAKRQEPVCYTYVSTFLAAVENGTSPTGLPGAGNGPGSGSGPGVVQSVDAEFITETYPYTGSIPIDGPITVAVIPRIGLAPGIIIIATPTAGPGGPDGPPPGPPPDGPPGLPPHGPRPTGPPGPETIIIPSSGTFPGTTIVRTRPPPPPFSTSFVPYLGTSVLTAPRTILTVPPRGTTPGYIVVQTPARYVTTVAGEYTGTEIITGPTAVSTVMPSGTVPGTIIVQTARNNDVDPNGVYVTSVAGPYTGPGIITAPTTLAVIQPSGTAPGTIIIQTPGTYVTTTVPYSGPGNIVGVQTSTVPPSGTVAGTVVVAIPRRYARVTLGAYDGPGVITAPITVSVVQPTGTSPGTIYIETPAPTVGPGGYVTQNQVYTGTGVITGRVTIATIPPSGTVPGTYIVEVPASYVTITQAYGGATPTTRTIPPSGTRPGTVVIQTPARFVTTTRPYTGASPITAPVTSTIQPIGNNPGTIIVQTPVFTTVTTGYSAPVGAGQTTTVPASGNVPGTVIVQTGTLPGTYVTVTQPYTGASPILSPVTEVIPPSGGNPGTVIVETPVFTTVTSRYTGAAPITGVTTETVPASGNVPGTVIVETPQFTSSTRFYTGPGNINGPQTTTVPASGTVQGTVIVEIPATTVSTTQPYTGPGTLTGPSTSTIPASGTQPATVVVFTPVPPSPSPSPVCAVAGFLIQYSDLYGVNLQNAQISRIASNVGGGIGEINAIGYNVLNNLIYGIIQRNATLAVLASPQIITIDGATGASNIIATLPTLFTFDTGDIDASGYYWISNQGNQYFQIDARPTSANYLNVVSQGNAGAPFIVHDWAYVPGGGNALWTLAGSLNQTVTYLLRFDTTAKTWSTLYQFGNVAGNQIWGAVYASADGFLFAQENVSGRLYRTPIATGLGGPPVLVATGPVLNNNDGARCINAPNV